MSIPSHPTVLRVRMDTLGESQQCPFHPIPLYCGLEWTHWGNPNECPSHPIPLYCGFDRAHWGNPKLSHAQYPKTQVSIPSHCTVVSNGHTGESQAVPRTIPQGGDWLEITTYNQCQWRARLGCHSNKQ